MAERMQKSSSSSRNTQT